MYGAPPPPFSTSHRTHDSTTSRGPCGVNLSLFSSYRSFDPILVESLSALRLMAFTVNNNTRTPSWVESDGYIVSSRALRRNYNTPHCLSESPACIKVKVNNNEINVTRNGLSKRVCFVMYIIIFSRNITVALIFYLGPLRTAALIMITIYVNT